MQVTETSSEGLKHEYQVLVSKNEVTGKISARLEELQKTIKINGFRPGKVPIGILRQRYVESVMGEVLQGMVDQTSQQVLEEKGVRPALQPQIEVKTFEEGKDLEYVLQVEVLPEIDCPELKSLKFTRLKSDPKDTEVDSAVERLAEQSRGFSEVKRARKSKSGEILVIDFNGMVDGESLESAQGTDYNLRLGNNSFLPGFDDEIIGLKPGEEKSVTVLLPDTYPDEKVRGSQAVFDILVKKHLEPDELKIDDDLAKKLGLDTIAALRDAAKAELQRGYDEQSRNRLKREILDSFAEKYDFNVPSGMVEKEFEGIWGQFQQDMKQSDTDMEKLGKSEEELRSEYNDIAVRRIRLALLLSEIGRENDISVEREELNRAIIDQARRFPGREKEVADYFGSNPEALSSIHAPLFEDKVIDFVVEMAEISEELVTVEALYANPEDPVQKPNKTKRISKKKSAAKKSEGVAPKKKRAARSPAKKKNV